MRRSRANKVDDNQDIIVEVFRRAGFRVTITSGAGDGFTDLVISKANAQMPLGGINVLVEVKDGDKPPSERRLTPAQIVFHDDFPGPIRIVESIDDARALISEINNWAGIGLTVNRADTSGRHQDD